MRASMAIPAVFSPVRIGDKVLVDGCLLNNYPADVAREMGADIIIGIDESFRPTIFHPLWPKVMTEKQRVTAYKFENMTTQDESFLRQKFHLHDARQDSIDAKLKQEITTSMRVDLFYQTAKCRRVPLQLTTRTALGLFALPQQTRLSRGNTVVPRQRTFL